MRGVLLACAVVLALVRPAHADDPWAVGVSETNKQAAEKLLDKGNAQFLEHKYPEALATYQQARQSWDHPAIRFNIVRCLILLDRPLEAIEHLDAALQYGAAPIGEALYAEALAYKKLLANQIGDLEVACTQGGVTLSLDGHPLAECPATKSQRVAPGQHQIVATKQGYMTRTIEVVVVGGRREHVDVKLAPLTHAAKIVHRWPQWVPWVVFGTGVGAAAIGTGLELKASSDFTNYDRQVARDCANRCDPMQAAALDELRQSAKLENTIAISFIAVGALTAAGGGAMLYLNRGRTVYPKSLEVAPVNGGAMVSLEGVLW